MQKRVLLVQNDPFQARRIQFELQRYGLTVDIAVTNTAGLHIAERQLPSAIVLDSDFPGIDAYYLCRTLKTNPTTAHIPVIFLSYCDETSTVLGACQIGAYDYIRKDTFSEHNLIEVLRGLNLV